MDSQHELNFSYFEKMLTAEKEKVIANIDSLKAEVNAFGVEDEIDDIADMAELHIDNTLDQMLLQRLEKELVEIDAALARIQAGVYGICEKTGKKIPIERLLANPSARFILNV